MHISTKIMSNNYNNSNIKRLFDIIFGLLGIIILILLLPIIFLIVKLDTSGPVFYKRDRLGIMGKRFQLVKLRTMSVGSDRNKCGLRTKSFDTRVTKSGRFLRKCYLDEFPQFWNVLIGEMSVVGPRPEFPELYNSLEKISPNFRDRLIIKPGITGLAQVEYKHAHNDIEAAGRLEFDMDYVRSSNFLLDIKIILLTIKRSLRLGGS